VQIIINSNDDDDEMNGSYYQVFLQEKPVTYNNEETGFL
jgi:hypothetical protein